MPALLAAAPLAAVQPPPPSRPPATSKASRGAASPQAAQVAAARAHLAAGRAAEALDAINTVLAANPRNAEAARVKVDALLALGKPREAFAAYDAYTGGVPAGDAPALRSLANAVLKGLSEAPLAEVRAGAAEARARQGDAAARRWLTTAMSAAPPTADSWAATVALARLGDQSAIAAVVDVADHSEGSARVGALRSLQDVHSPRVASVVKAALATDDPMVQETAAEVAGAQRLAAVRPDLVKVLQTSRFLAPLRAAVALKQMGDPAGDQRIAEALTSEVADTRIIAARALAAGKDTTWVAAVRPLLASDAPLTRIWAAELMQRVDARPAMATLSPFLADPNPAIRTEAVRVVAAMPDAPLAALRPGLQDDSAEIRLLCATSLARRR